MGIKIGELARKSGVPISTIHYYVKEGLLPLPEKVNKKMAYYDEACLKKLEAIQHLKEKRYYPLAIIKNILRRIDAAVNPSGFLVHKKYLLLQAQAHLRFRQQGIQTEAYG